MAVRFRHISLIIIALLSIWLGVRVEQLIEKKRLINVVLKGKPVSLTVLDSLLGLGVDNNKLNNHYLFGLIYNPLSCDCSIWRINNDIKTIDSLMISQNIEYELKIIFLGNHEKLGKILVAEMNNSFHGLSSYRELDYYTYKALGEPIGDGLLLVTKPSNQIEGKLYKIGVVLQTLETASSIL